jgi:PAS domain S-box-containing protein
MSAAKGSQTWLHTTVDAVRELMEKRLAANPEDAELKRDVEMALEELDVMWEELEGQAERLGRESERYAEFFDYAPDAYLVTDVGGNIREAHQAATELLRCPRAELVGRPLGGFVPAEERVSFLSHFVGALSAEGAQPATWQARIQPAEGPPLPAVFSVRAIPLQKSGVGGLCWLVRPA